MKKQNRRAFLRDSSTLLGGSWLSFSMPGVLAAAQLACSRKASDASWSTLSEAEAVGFAAIVDQIIPPDETPGASDMGAVHFIDAALEGFMQGAGGMLRQGLAELNARSAGGVFADLDFDTQTMLLSKVEATPFFQTMLFLTQAGVFALPAHGGNINHSGWQLIGFEHRHVWQPPYGYYDTQVAGQGEADHG